MALSPMQVIRGLAQVVDTKTLSYQMDRIQQNAYNAINAIVSQLNGTSSALSYWSGAHDQNNTWQVVSTSYVDMTQNSAGAFVQGSTSGFGTVSTAAGGLPGITFTPVSSTAAYLVAVTPNAYNNTTGHCIAMKLTDGTSVVATGNNYNQGTAGNVVLPLIGIYLPQTSSDVTLKIQAKNTNIAETGFIGGATTSAIEWTLVRVA